jgi:hypothetical protein
MGEPAGTCVAIKITQRLHALIRTDRLDGEGKVVECPFDLQMKIQNQAANPQELE